MTLKNSVCVFICDLGVSSWWNMTETPPKGGVQGHPIQMPELVLLSVEEQQLFSELLSTSARDNGRKTPPSWERSCRANQSASGFHEDLLRSFLPPSQASQDLLQK